MSHTRTKPEIYIKIRICPGSSVGRARDYCFQGREFKSHDESIFFLPLKLSRDLKV